MTNSELGAEKLGPSELRYTNAHAGTKDRAHQRFGRNCGSGKCKSQRPWELQAGTLRYLPRPVRDSRAANRQTGSDYGQGRITRSRKYL